MGNARPSVCRSSASSLRSAACALDTGLERSAFIGVAAVLYAHDRTDGLGFLNLFDRDVGQADVADLAGFLQLGQGADAVCERDARIGRVQLIERDALDTERLEA